MSDRERTGGPDGGGALTPRDEAMLGELFASARSRAAAPSADLMARILADAAQAQPRGAAAPSPEAAGRPAPHGGFWAELAFLVGGWPAVGGLVSAAMAGLWVGFSGLGGPADLSVVLSGAGLAGTGNVAAVELLPGTDAFGLADLGGEGP
ncbi:MAG: dihydroorotate dehydrogenase [Pseudomonadota bacterium]